MENYELIEREALNQIDDLPVIYKKLQYISNDNIFGVLESDKIDMESSRHQTKCLAAQRFYKNIEIFVL